MEKFNADRLVTINVDMQNDFMPGGSLAVPNGDTFFSELNRMNEFTRRQNGLVVFTGDQHPPATPHFGPDAWPVHCVAGTHGAQLDRRLNVAANDIILDKGMGQTDGYSAFEGVTRDHRTLEQIVKPARRERVAALISGVATEYCVKNTVMDGLKVSQNGGELKVFVARDAIHGINEKDVATAMDTMRKAGAIIINSAQVLNGEAFQLTDQQGV
jgi:nicotinamidase/pyrazinamidase